MTTWQVRDATPDDAAACAAIYAAYVRDTVITFEQEAPTAEQMLERMKAAQRRHAWLVLEDAGRVVGYAYATTFKERVAYRWSCEVSIYLETGLRRGGGGRTLYAALLDRLRRRGFRFAVSVMTLPNDASLGLHAALGFETVGVLRGIGFKHGAWHDVAYAQLTLAEGEDPPAETC